MSQSPTRGGFAGDPATALTMAGSTGCCGNPARTADIALPDPHNQTAPCCGTAADAQTADACCAPAAKADAVAAGTGCC